MPRQILDGVGRRLEALGRRLRRQAGSGEVWIDVGAHLGERTFPAAAADPSLLVYAFEPNLRVAAQRMGRLPNYVVVPMAVAEEDGCAPFFLNACDAASSLLPLDPEGVRRWIGGDALREERRVSVPTVRLDTFLGQMGIARVSFLKVDAQGADLAVLRSAGERLRDIARITLEVQVSPSPLYQGAGRKEEAEAYLAAAGFVLAGRERQSHDQEENLTFTNPRQPAGQAAGAAG